MAVIQNNRPMSLLQELLNPQQNGPSFGQQIGHNLNQQILQHQATQRDQASRQQEFQQQQMLLQEKERQRAQQGAAMARLLGVGEQREMAPGQQNQEASQEISNGAQRESNPPKTQSFGDRDFGDIAREALANGFSSQEILQLKDRHDKERSEKYSREIQKEHNELRKEGNEIRKEANKARKEAPERNKVISEMEDIHKEALKAKARTVDYDTAISLAKSGKLQAGLTRQLLDKMGWEGIGLNDVTQMFDKVASRIPAEASAAMGGGGGSERMKLISKGFISSKMNPTAIVPLAEASKLADFRDEILLDQEVAKLKKEYRGKGVEWENSILDRARENIEPEREEINKKISNLFGEALRIQTGQRKINIPQGTQIGSILKDPTTGQRNMMVTGGKIMPEKDIIKTTSELEKDLPARTNDGKTVRDKNLGVSFKSVNGKWVPV